MSREHLADRDAFRALPRLDAPADEHYECPAYPLCGCGHSCEEAERLKLIEQLLFNRRRHDLTMAAILILSILALAAFGLIGGIL